MSMTLKMSMIFENFRQKKHNREEILTAPRFRVLYETLNTKKRTTALKKEEEETEELVTTSTHEYHHRRKSGFEGFLISVIKKSHLILILLLAKDE